MNGYGSYAMFRRIAAAALILSVAAILLVSLWPQLFGLQRMPLVLHVVSFRTLVAGVAAGLIVILIVGAAFSRAFRGLATSLIVMLVVFVLATAAVLSTRGFGDHTHLTAENEESADLTVLTWNTHGPATTPEQIAELALETGADIVVLPETTLETTTQTAVLMRAGGQPMWAHTLAYDQISPARSTSLLTSATLGEYDYDRVAVTTAVLPSLVATPRDGAGPTIIAVHPVAPMQGQLENWPRDLQILADLCTGENIIMAGDFNATVDHMTGMGTGPNTTLGACTSTAMASKTGALGTWPTWLPAILSTPIDHIMATDDWAEVDAEVIESRDDSGSDHRPVVARLKRVR